MSGAESSASGSKRRRGPVARPRGTPDPPMDAERHGRQIKYSENERVPSSRVRRIREHTLLRFELGTFEYERLDRFVSMNLLHHRNIDWNLLGALGQRDRVAGMLGPRWMNVLSCDWPQYKELTLEFHATFIHHDDQFDEVDAVSFALGRQMFEMTIPQFAVATGFYTLEEVQRPEFVTLLRGANRRQRDYSIGETELTGFWTSIADSPFSTSMVESDIRDPVLRYIHRVLACTVIGRYSGEEKVSWMDLFCMYCIDQGREPNFGCVLAQSFNRGRRGGSRARLDMGPYVYRLAANLGVFDRYNPDLMTLGPVTTPIDVKDLQKAGILTRDDPPRMEGVRAGYQAYPPQGTEAADTMRSSIPTHRQRPVFRRDAPGRQYPLREPIPDPLTLESLCGRMDTYYERSMDYWRSSHEEVMRGQHRQDDALRYMMSSMHIQVPDFFQPPGPSGEHAGGDDED